MIDKLFITKQEQKLKNKNKIGLPPNKRYRLTPLARHNNNNNNNNNNNKAFSPKQVGVG